MPKRRTFRTFGKHNVDIFADVTATDPEVSRFMGTQSQRATIIWRRYTKTNIVDTMKHVEFLGNSLKALREMPFGGRRALGFQLERVQRGVEPLDWKPMPSVGSGVCEIRARDTAGAYRMMYVAKFEDVIYVLHCFAKKTQKTAKLDIELARSRYLTLLRDKT